METITPPSVLHGYALPPFAPLSAPQIAQVLHQHLAETSAVTAIQRYPAGLAWLLQLLPGLRGQVFRELDPIVQSDELNVNAFLSLLRAASPPTNRPNPQVISNWRGRGILQTPRRGYVGAQRAAAILIARRLVPSAARNWLPDELPPSEPDWWCWRQDEPASPITLCPVPLPADLPRSALLWVPWAGATWLLDWFPTADGALYCGRIQSSQALAEAAQTWQLPLDTKARTDLETSESPGANIQDAQQTWVRLATPLVSDRFAPILVSTEPRPGHSPLS